MNEDRYIEFTTPMAHNSQHTNAQGPIVGIEIMHADSGIVYWSHDGNAGVTAYDSLESLCESYGFDLAAIKAMVQS